MKKEKEGETIGAQGKDQREEGEGERSGERAGRQKGGVKNRGGGRKGTSSREEGEE